MNGEKERTNSTQVHIQESRIPPFGNSHFYNIPIPQLDGFLRSELSACMARRKIKHRENDRRQEQNNQRVQ